MKRSLRCCSVAALMLMGCAGPFVTTRAGGVTVHSFVHDASNAQLVVKDGNAFLFDTGYEKNAPALEADIRAAGIDPAKLKAIIISHGHADHAGGARHFHQKFGVPVLLGSGDEGMFSSGKNEPVCPVGLIAKFRENEDVSATYTGSSADTVISAPTELRELTGIDAKVMPLPGHTRGSLVVSVGDVLLVGDLLRGSIIGSGAETHFYMCDLDDNRHSIARLLSDNPGTKLVFVGHFGPLTPESVREHFGP